MFQTYPEVWILFLTMKPHYDIRSSEIRSIQRHILGYGIFVISVHIFLFESVCLYFYLSLSVYLLSWDDVVSWKNLISWHITPSKSPNKPVTRKSYQATGVPYRVTSNVISGHAQCKPRRSEHTNHRITTKKHTRGFVINTDMTSQDWMRSPCGCIGWEESRGMYMKRH